MQDTLYPVDYAQATAEQNTFVAKVYGWMSIGLLLTAIVALATVNTPSLIAAIFLNKALFFGLIIGELLLVVVLSAATVPEKENNQRLAELLKVPLSEDKFFMEAHVKLRPVDFANEGIYLCGLAHSPKYTEENITQALAAAGRAACTLNKDSLEVGGVISVIDEERCASCLTCLRECPYDAPFINARGKAEIEAAKCQGCGNCVAACPAKAIQLRTFTDDQLRALFRSILKVEEAAEVCS